MTNRELYVAFDDGRGHVVARARCDDQAQVRELERMAWDYLARPNVARAIVSAPRRGYAGTWKGTGR